MSNLHGIDRYKVSRIETLGMHNDAEAKSILEKIAHQVQPIMRRRKFSCPVLKEFFPRSPNLLGINVGGGGGNTLEICLRLRPASSPNSFMHYESVLATMLHELSHNMHSPHAGPFYKLLDELKAECEELMAKGIGGTGAGFDAPSAGKVGGRFIGPSDQISNFDKRAIALKAAEQRAKRQLLMSSGPRKLGEDTTGLRNLPPALAAAAAAERRALDNKWCPTEQMSQEIDEGASIHAALQAVLDSRADAGGGSNNGGASLSRAAVEKKKTDGKEEERKQKQQQQQLPPSLPTNNGGVNNNGGNNGGNNNNNVSIIDLTNEASQPDDDTNITANSTEWECASCTFINTKPLALQCDICGSVRPSTKKPKYNTSSPPLRLD